MCGALIVHFAKLRGRKLAGFITIILTTLILPTPAFLLSCNHVEIAGVTTSYVNGLVSVVEEEEMHVHVEILIHFCVNFH